MLVFKDEMILSTSNFWQIGTNKDLINDKHGHPKLRVSVKINKITFLSNYMQFRNRNA